ncbi:MAG: ATP-dependent DNA helicase RecQ [Clostridia bacterium]|nr:ATP-dependent DNA helicase RecQ [Clostridia bacterium]
MCLQQLQDTFGLQGFRPGQKAAADALLSGRDLLCILPTGAGKSLCWQLPAVLHAGMTVVVSPLIALMRDQVMHLTARGIPALTIDSLMTEQERAQAMQRLQTGEVRIAYVSPERLETVTFRQLCQEHTPWLLVIDEAHCVVQWGQEFRPAYGKIRSFVASLPQRPVICAMTATADKRMRKQLTDNLKLRFPRQVTLPVLRDNLQFHVRTTISRSEEILRILTGTSGKAVVFCRTRARTEAMAAYLIRQGFAAAYYHAGLDRTERNLVQQRFSDGETRILAATTAFGLGIDIPDKRFVIHDHLPDNVIDYVQQSGRAGRDGFRADCYLLIDPAEFVRTARYMNTMYRRLRKQPFKRFAALKEVWWPKRRLMQALMTSDCIPAAIAGCFGKRAGRCGCCSACGNGPILRKIPPLHQMKAWQVRAWLLRWQREAIARREGCRDSKILTNAALVTAAKRMMLKNSTSTGAADMERLMSNIQRAEMYHAKENGTS